ncbi:MAG: ice-binding family protein [Candidatus Woesearchaeota archaeon]|nr:ice-binding family protein [Candidatus Woesearchaeota archaeon]
MACSAYAAQPAVDLGTAGNFVILSEAQITDATPAGSVITGNVGVHPAAGTFIEDISCSTVGGTIYDNNAGYTGGFDSDNTCLMTDGVLLGNAVQDMDDARLDVQARLTNDVVHDTNEAGSGTLNGLTFNPGLHTWSTAVSITGDITLDCKGDASGVFIFQIAQTLDISSDKSVNLINGCLPQNIFWAVSGQTTLGTGSVFNGNILDVTGIAIQTGATLNGRALAQTAITLDANTVKIPVAIVSAKYTISGTVSISGVGPQSNAFVTLKDNSGVTISGPINTDVNGFYTFKVADSAAIYTITVDNVIGFASTSQKYVVKGDITADFVFGPAPTVTLSGTVTNLTDDLIAGADITVNTGGGSLVTAKTGPLGTYSVSVLDNKDYDVTASIIGYETVNKSISADGSNLVLNFVFGEVCSTHTFYQDADNDGYGNLTSSGLACTAPVGYVADSTDCNDADAAIKPGAADNTNDDIDNDCDGITDEDYSAPAQVVEDVPETHRGSGGGGSGGSVYAPNANTPQTLLTADGNVIAPSTMLTEPSSDIGGTGNSSTGANLITGAVIGGSKSNWNIMWILGIIALIALLLTLGILLSRRNARKDALLKENLAI